ncbi:MAG: hypothetical protein ACREO0_00950, partial [Pseudoxanthomonas sp.]
MRSVTSSWAITTPRAALERGETRITNQRCRDGEWQGYSKVKAASRPANTARMPSVACAANPASFTIKLSQALK